MNATLKSILLWISIIPVSILCSIFIPGIYKYIVSFFINSDSGASIYFSEYPVFFFQGGLFVIPAFLLAPKYKIQTAIVLYISFILVSIIGEYNLKEFGIGWFGIAIRILGATVIFFGMRNEYKGEAKPEKLSNDERQALIDKIEGYAKVNPKYKAHVEEKLEEFSRTLGNKK